MAKPIAPTTTKPEALEKLLERLDLHVHLAVDPLRPGLVARTSHGRALLTPTGQEARTRWDFGKMTSPQIADAIEDLGLLHRQRTSGSVVPRAPETNVEEPPEEPA